VFRNESFKIGEAGAAIALSTQPVEPKRMGDQLDGPEPPAQHGHGGVKWGVPWALREDRATADDDPPALSWAARRGRLFPTGPTGCLFS
jgi:hypothetical protein